MSIAAPETTPTQTTRARWLVHPAWCHCEEIAEQCGFDLSWRDDEEGYRTLMLLGPDSPADMAMRLHRSRFATRHVLATAGVILRWMIERGEWWTGTRPVLSFETEQE
jgi:hypothetical protein